MATFDGEIPTRNLYRRCSRQVLKTLDLTGPQHGYGLALRIEQISESALRVNQGTIYLCLVRTRRRKPGAVEESTRVLFVHGAPGCSPPVPERRG